MGGRSIEALIKPDLLKWARETIGMDIEQVSKKLKSINGEEILKWEKGISRPSISQAEKLASLYKRSLALFFLPKPPKEPPLPRDFRTFPDRAIPLSRDTRLAIRQARRVQSLMKELSQELGHRAGAEIVKAQLSDNPEKLASRIRERLGIGIGAQFSWRNEYQAFNQWATAIEKENILVLRIRMPMEETRAFSIEGSQFPIIVVNSKDWPNARVFSLFHEYAHLMLRISGICDMREDFAPREKSIENFCDHFAGALLVPKDDLLNEPLVWQKRWDEESLKRLSIHYKVSKEVVLRRLFYLEKVSSTFYWQKRKEWATAYPKKEKEKETKFKRNRPREIIREKGRPFVSLVFEAFSEGKISYSEVSDYLSLKTKYLPSVENLMRG